MYLSNSSTGKCPLLGTNTSGLGDNVDDEGVEAFTSDLTELNLALGPFLPVTFLDGLELDFVYEVDDLDSIGDIDEFGCALDVVACDDIA